MYFVERCCMQFNIIGLINSTRTFRKVCRTFNHIGATTDYVLYEVFYSTYTQKVSWSIVAFSSYILLPSNHTHCGLKPTYAQFHDFDSLWMNR